MSHSSVGLVVLLAGLFACGGAVDDADSGSQEPDDRADEAEPGADEGEEPRSGGGNGVGKGDAPVGDLEQLPECKKKGIRVELEPEQCAWLADHRCYEDKLDACGCICPRDRDSTCMSGLDAGPSGRVEVTCD